MSSGGSGIKYPYNQEEDMIRGSSAGLVHNADLQLRRRDYEEYKSMLREITLSRGNIKEIMGFAYDKIESAEEVTLTDMSEFSYVLTSL